MTPKEKAKELVNRFSTVGLQQRNEGIECALIAVDELLKQEEYMIAEFKYACSINNIRIITEAVYWQQVKQEIEKL